MNGTFLPPADYHLRCDGCGDETDSTRLAFRCGRCQGTLSVVYAWEGVRLPTAARGLWDYASVLPITNRARIVTLGEGGTPLLEARGDHGCSLFWKNESRNPTGSQKDRAISVSISKALEWDAPRVILASTGSSGLACAAYSARAGLRCVTLVPDGTPAERSIVMESYGATVIEVPGPYRETARILDLLAGDPSWYPAQTNRRTNPYQAEGARTIAFEIWSQLGRAPNWLVVPVGGGGTLSGIYRGFRDLRALGEIDRLPRFAAVQPVGFNTVERAIATHLRTDADIADIQLDSSAHTVMNNLRAGRKSDAADVVAAVLDTNGAALSVTDEQAIRCQAALATEEGLFCEPSSAAAAAGVAVLRAEGTIQPGHTVVAIVTGSGFRQMEVLRTGTRRRLPANADRAAFERAVASSGP